jgi:hypothetical protein
VDAVVTIDLADEWGALPDAVEMLIPPSDGATEVAPDLGHIAHTPRTGFVGNDTFLCSVRGGGREPDELLVAVTVAAMRIVVVAVDDQVSVPHSSTSPIDVLRNDFLNDLIDPQVWLTVKSVTQPTHGGTVSVTEDDRILYRPSEGFCGTDVFIYETWDQHEWSAGGIVQVHVMCPSNEAPKLHADAAETSLGKAIALDVLANDIDPDGDSLSITRVTQPAHRYVSVTTDGRSITYTPPEGWTGTSTFGYIATDGRGGLGAALVTVDVLATDRPWDR